MTFNPHTIRYKKRPEDGWWYMGLFGSDAEMVKRAKEVGKPELGVPAYHEVQVVKIIDPPVVWSSNGNTVPQTGLE